MVTLTGLPKAHSASQFHLSASTALADPTKHLSLSPRRGLQEYKSASYLPTSLVIAWKATCSFFLISSSCYAEDLSHSQMSCKFLVYWKHLTFVFFSFSFIIHMCIQGLVHFSPLPPPPPLPPTPPPPSPPTPSIPSRNYFALISNFVVERV
jgi:hypothetical protein